MYIQSIEAEMYLNSLLLDILSDRMSIISIILNLLSSSTIIRSESPRKSVISYSDDEVNPLEVKPDEELEVHSESNSPEIQSVEPELELPLSKEDSEINTVSRCPGAATTTSSTATAPAPPASPKPSSVISSYENSRHFFDDEFNVYLINH
uniref:Uncharacterized protein n=1 Tax=Caenorhabditis tropicalis TaxID=1561998 RepID=A0A1I7U8S1_9PELO